MFWKRGSLNSVKFGARKALPKIALKRGAFHRIVDQCHPGVEGGIKIAILVIADAAIEMQIVKQSHVALHIDTVTLAGPAGERILFGLAALTTRLLLEVVPVFRAQRE